MIIVAINVHNNPKNIRRICSNYVDPSCLTAFNACRLIPLDKLPGVRPIGVVKVCRRIIGKAVMKIVKLDVMESVAGRQFCAGLNGGCEAAVHCMSTVFELNEASLFVDATNAFNSLNRATTLINLPNICPALAPILINTYRDPVSLFVNGETLTSKEGTTQGDPLGMAMYAIGIQPLIKHLESFNTQQIWYADDSTAGGNLENLRAWWDELCKLGPKFGYFPNSKKTHLLVKPSSLPRSEMVFADTNIKIVSDGVQYLGGAIGSESFIRRTLFQKVQLWSEEIVNLVEVAESEPHAAFAAFTHGISASWNYFSRVTDITSLATETNPFQQLETLIREKLVPALTGAKHFNDATRSLLSLPFRLGGLNLINPALYLPSLYQISRHICSPLFNHYFSDSKSFDPIKASAIQQEIKSTITSEHLQSLANFATDLKTQLDPISQHSLNLSMEKGASNWLSALPIKSYSFHLHKSAFRDAIHLRYGWNIPDKPSTCTCGQPFSIEHTLSCAKGGFPSIRHNEIRDITASLLSEVCSNVEIEPHLQPLTGEQLTLQTANREPNARLDIAANGVWGGRFKKRILT